MVTAITPHNPQILRPAAKLAEILAARLCHDLAGLTGSLGGALELAEEDAEALSVARDSALALHARLTLLRAAFGPADAAQTMGTLRHWVGLIAPPRRVRLALDWPNDTIPLPGPVARLLLVLCLLGVESLAGEGEMRLEARDAGQFSITLSGPRTAWPSALHAGLAAPETAIDLAETEGPRGLLAPLAVLMAGCAAVSLRLSSEGAAENAHRLLISIA